MSTSSRFLSCSSTEGVKPHHAHPTHHLESQGQALATFGKHAKHAASDLAFGKKVTLQTFGKDKYGRTIADVILPDGLSLNQELVKQGWWWYRKYAPGDMVLERLEKEAREGRKGLWADPRPVPQWVYRRLQRRGFSPDLQNW